MLTSSRRNRNLTRLSRLRNEGLVTYQITQVDKRKGEKVCEVTSNRLKRRWLPVFMVFIYV